MSVLIDAGPIIGYFDQADADHAPVLPIIEAILQGVHGVALVPDVVVDEVLTFLRRRPGRIDLSARAAEFFWGPWPADARAPQVVQTSIDLLHRATELHLQHHDRRLSLTDCVLVLHARELEAKVFTLDAGFEGLVPVVAMASG